MHMQTASHNGSEAVKMARGWTPLGQHPGSSQGPNYLARPVRRWSSRVLRIGHIRGTLPAGTGPLGAPKFAKTTKNGHPKKVENRARGAVPPYPPRDTEQGTYPLHTKESENKGDAGRNYASCKCKCV